jgi:predicted Zn-dependent peptidase
MSEVKIACNTGVRITDKDARVLLALSEYLNSALFAKLREEDGETYTPEASYEPDPYSGIFKVAISTSEDPERIERKTLETIEKMKSDIDPRELKRFRDRVEFARRKNAEASEEILERLVERVLYGASAGDLAIATVSREEMLAAARKFLPSHRHAYVRLALRGR